MTTQPANKTQRVQYLLRSAGFLSSLGVIARKLVSPLVDWDSAFVTIRYLHPTAPDPSSESNDDYTTFGERVENLEQLEALQKHFADKTLYASLETHLNKSPNHIAIVGRLKQRDDPNETIVGYRALMRGAYTYWENALQGPMPNDCIYVEDIFILPAYRGQRVHLSTRLTMQAYCRKNGITKVVGFVKTHNRASLAAHFHDSQGGHGTLNGTIRKISLLSGLYKRVTPPQTVLEIIKAPPPDTPGA